MVYSYFSSDLTEGVLIFEILLAVVLTGVIIYGLSRYRFFLWRFFVLSFGVFCFEGLSGALWINSHLGSYAYIHNDISWIMTLTWTSIIFIVKFFYDAYFQKKSLVKEFGFVVFLASIACGILLIILKEMRVFGYSSAMKNLVSEGIFLFGRPLESLIYLPVFIFTVYTFYKYWELAMYDKSLFMHYKISIQKDILISTSAIILIGYLMHPLLGMTFFGAIALILGYLLILIATNLITNIVKDTPLFPRFMGAIFIFSLLGTLYTDILVRYGVIHISQAIRDTYTSNTITIPYLIITDVEFVGIVLFSFLMVAMIRYFKIITDNTVIKLDEKNMTFRGFRSLYSNSK